MQSWKTLSRTTILNHSIYLKVENRVVEAPNGQVIENWPWVIARDFVNVIPVNEKGNLLLFRQGKYGFQGESIAPVGGYLEPGELPEETARRELREEMGFSAVEWIPLASTLLSPNTGFAHSYPFIARQLTYEGAIPSDDLEEQVQIEVSLDELESALLGGGIKVTDWYASFSNALMWLRREQNR